MKATSLSHFTSSPVHNQNAHFTLLLSFLLFLGVVVVGKNFFCLNHFQLYHEDPETGKMYVALSSDSTCQNDLKSPKEGYETLVLTAIAPPPLPFEVISNRSILLQ